MSVKTAKTDASMSTVINGHKVTFRFAEKHNPNIAQLVKDTLIDSFIHSQKVKLSSGEV